MSQRVARLQRDHQGCAEQQGAEAARQLRKGLQLLAYLTAEVNCCSTERWCGQLHRAASCSDTVPAVHVLLQHASCRSSATPASTPDAAQASMQSRRCQQSLLLCRASQSQRGSRGALTWWAARHSLCSPSASLKCARRLWSCCRRLLAGRPALPSSRCITAAHTHYSRAHISDAPPSALQGASA